MQHLHIGLVVVLSSLHSCASAPLPSCESDTEAHCIGEDADLSPEGISACLQGLSEDVRSSLCSQYLAMIGGCTAEIERGGICADAHANGETAACLIQRVTPDKLSEACAAALPAQEERSGLRGKFWADGKRELSDDEMAELNDEDLDDYKRWMKKRKGPKSGKDRERAYAVRSQKTAQAEKRVLELATKAAAESLANGDSTRTAELMTRQAAREAADAAVAEDMTGTLKKFTDASVKKIAKEALAAATAKGEL